MSFIAKFQNQEDSGLEIETALREALANAIVHGNQEDPHKRVYVACRCTPDGRGFDHGSGRGDRGFHSNAVQDPTTPENRLARHGRGIYLMKTLMDEIRFELGGAVVYMRKEAQRRASGLGYWLTAVMAVDKSPVATPVFPALVRVPSLLTV